MSPTLIGLSAVASGAALGACLRWGLSAALNGIQPLLPLGTLLANLAGGLLAGMAMAWIARHPELSPGWRLFITTGFLGGLTTFSTFSAESLALVMRGDWLPAVVHSVVHVAGSLGAAAVGYRLAS